MELSQIISIAFSSAALLISAITFWRSQVSPFKLEIQHDTPRFSLYKIEHDEADENNPKEWWIPSFDIGISLYNMGVRPGKIEDIRIKAITEADSKEDPINYYPKWIVDYPKFQANNSERFKWIQESVKKDWCPILIKGKENLDIHLILEADRIEVPFSKKFKLHFEIVPSNKKKWVSVADLEFIISEGMFDDKSTYSPYNNRLSKYRV